MAALSIALLALLARAAVALPPAAPPASVGRFSTFTNALPSGQLPHAPMLGNGAIGVLVDGRSGGGGCSLDMWLGSSSFWSCGTCTTLAKGCCRLVALGGLRLALPAAAGCAAFAAEQRVGAGTIAANMTTTAGGVLSALVYLHPSKNAIVVNATWTPAADDAQALSLNVSVWAEAASGNGAHPAPKATGCAVPSTGQATACAAAGLPVASAQALFVARQAATTPDTPLPIVAAWAAVINGGAGAASVAVTGSAPGGAFSTTAVVNVLSSTPLSIVVAEAEARGNPGADPTPDAVVQAALADAGGVAAAAAAFWQEYWGRASVSLPGQPLVEAFWAGAQHALAATASTDANVPPPGLYGVWATSDGCNWNGDCEAFSPLSSSPMLACPQISLPFHPHLPRPRRRHARLQCGGNLFWRLQQQSRAAGRELLGLPSEVGESGAGNGAAAGEGARRHVRRGRAALRVPPRPLGLPVLR